jgi:hypothetical protein
VIYNYSSFNISSFSFGGFCFVTATADGVKKSHKKYVFSFFSNLQVEAAFKKFDQTGNDKLNYREFCDMMNKKTERAASRPRLSTADSQTKPPPIGGGTEVTSPKKEL